MVITETAMNIPAGRAYLLENIPKNINVCVLLEGTVEGDTLEGTVEGYIGGTLEVTLQMSEPMNTHSLEHNGGSQGSFIMLFLVHSSGTSVAVSLTNQPLRSAHGRCSLAGYPNLAHNSFLFCMHLCHAFYHRPQLQ